MNIPRKGPLSPWGLRLSLRVTGAMLTLGGSAHAQECFPPRGSHEAQLFAALAVPLAFSVAEAPEGIPTGHIRLGFEATYLPEIDEEIRTPTICRPGKGPEDVDFLFALPRPRAMLGLPAGFVLEGSWVPPIGLNGVKANLFGFSLERGFPVWNNGTTLALRAHTTFGLIRAPVTCNDAALQNPSSECYQGTKSDDRYHPNSFGIEAVLTRPLAGGKIRPFIGSGLNALHPRFQVNFTNRFGSTDNTKVEVNLLRWAVLGGATWAAASRVALSAEAYSTPGDDVTGRVMLSYGLQ